MEFTEKTIGNYQLQRLLGQGIMGPVYQATHVTLKQDFAIKLIDPSFTHQPGFRERFTQTARALSELDHPGIVRVFDFGQHRDQVYIVMEYIAGLNLRQLMDELIKTRHWLPLAEAVLLIEQLCQAIDYAEGHNLPHKDIKPANLMLKPEPAENIPFQVVLTDLGLAQLVETSGTVQDQNYQGTPVYLSPEQVLGKDTDSRSTVYSLGILLYELVVGIMPFPIQTIMDALVFHTKESPPLPRSIRPELPVALEQVILKALEKEPAKRFQTAAEMGAALKNVRFDSTDAQGRITQKEVSLSTEYINRASTTVDLASSNVMKLDETQGQSTFVPPAPAPARFSIEVLAQGRELQRFIPSSDTFFIGRDKENQIVLDDHEVSRRHVQVTTNGTSFYVTDLRSRNGTYLENERLPPDTPQLWRSPQELRIAGFTLRLSNQARPETTRKEPRSEVLHMSVNPQQVTVEPGARISLSLFLLTQTLDVNHLSLSVIGIPSDWIANFPDEVMLTPGTQKEIAFSLQVPRSYQSKAGRYPITFRAKKQSDPGQFWETKQTLTIPAYSQFIAELDSPRLAAGQIGQITITNQGNIHELFQVQFLDLAGELAFQPPQLQVRVPPGRAVTAQFRGDARPSVYNLFGLFGNQRAHAFQAQVSLPHGEKQTVHADMVSKGLLPLWVLPTILLLGLLSVGSAAALWWYSTQRSATLDVITHGEGTVTSSPAGIDCGSTCSFNFRDNSSVTLIAVPISPSTFGGWSGGCSGTSLTCEVKMSDKQTITATFNPPGTQTLIVNKAGAGGGTITSIPAGIDCGSTCSFAFASNTSITLTAAPVPPATFGGWSGEGCSGTALTCTVTMDAVRSVIATFNVPGTKALVVSRAGTGTGSVTSSPAGIDCGSSCTFNFADNATVTLVAVSVPPSTFGGWGGACSGTTPTCTVTMNAVQNVIANFNSPGNQTLTVLVSKSATANGRVTSSPPGIDCGSDCTENYAHSTLVTLSAAADPGSTFTGWSGPCGGTGQCMVTMSEARSVIAAFSAPGTQSLIVTKTGTGTGRVTSSPGGIDCGSDCTESYSQNTSVILNASADPGSTFAGWSGACSGTGACPVTMSEVRSVIATFHADQELRVTVTRNGQASGKVTSNPIGIDCGTTCTVRYAYNTSVTLIPFADPGSTFTGWGGVCSASGTGPCSIIMSEARSVTATFQPHQQLSIKVTKNGAADGKVTSSIPGIDCEPDCSEMYPYNSQVTLTASPVAGSIFTGWSGCSSTTPTCTVTMSEARSVTATFSLVKLTVQVEGNGTVKTEGPEINCSPSGPTCSKDFPQGTEITLTAAADANSSFTGWSEGVCKVPSPNPDNPLICTITMDSDITVTASFDP